MLDLLDALHCHETAFMVNFKTYFGTSEKEGKVMKFFDAEMTEEESKECKVGD